MQRTRERKIPRQPPSCRAFVFSVETACKGAPALWAIGRSPLPAVEVSEGNRSPDFVTIIQFSDVGEPIGKIYVPRVIKSDAEWKHQLSPGSDLVTPRAGIERPFTGSTRDNREHGI